MTNDTTRLNGCGGLDEQHLQKKSYSRPTMIAYGAVRELTHGNSGTRPDGMGSAGPGNQGN